MNSYLLLHQNKELNSNIVEELSKEEPYLKRAMEFGDIWEILASIQKWDNTKLRCNECFLGEKLYKGLVHIQFDQLQILDLTKNNLQSIELIHTIQMFSLRAILVMENYITKIGCLRKGYWPSFKSLYIEQNLINDTEQIVDMKIKEFDYFWYEFINNATQKEDLRWIAKLESSSINCLWVEGKTRMKKERSLHTTVKKKFPNGKAFLK